MFIFLILGPFGPTIGPLKSDQALKKSKSDFVAEYPIWVSIKRTLTGKLVVDGQNLIYCVQLKLKYFGQKRGRYYSIFFKIIFLPGLYIPKGNKN